MDFLLALRQSLLFTHHWEWIPVLLLKCSKTMQKKVNGKESRISQLLMYKCIFYNLLFKILRAIKFCPFNLVSSKITTNLVQFGRKNGNSKQTQIFSFLDKNWTNHWKEPIPNQYLSPSQLLGVYITFCVRPGRIYS